MTNAMIMMVQTQKLAEEGKLKYTGNVLKGVTPDGKETELKEVEPIHTFRGWKDRGYSVKKGQHSDIKFAIWHYSKKKPKDITEEEAVQKGYCYMKVASWFRFDQVEPLKEKK